MNKKFITFCLFCMFNLHAFCQSSIVNGTYISWQRSVIDPTIGDFPTPKSPDKYPVVSLDNHTLYFYDISYDMTLQLYDETATLVYSVYVPAGTTSIDLPNSLVGDFEIQLYPNGNYYYYGYIIL